MTRNPPSAPDMPLDAPHRLAPWQVAIASAYANGTYWPLVAGPDWPQRLTTCPDPVFRYLMEITAPQNGCDGRERASIRICSLAMDVQAALSALNPVAIRRGSKDPLN